MKSNLYKKLLISILASSSGLLLGMEEHPFFQSNLHEHPLPNVNSALRIQTREALRRNDLETASSLMERLFARNMHPGTEAMAEVQKHGLAIPLALMAAQKDDDRVLQFLDNEKLIDWEKFRRQYEATAQIYMAEPVPKNRRFFEQQLYSYLETVTKLNKNNLLNPNLWDRYKTSLLQKAAGGRHPGLVWLLIKQGANINYMSHGLVPIGAPVTSLLIAKTSTTKDDEIKDILEIMQILLDKGANPNSLTALCRTPLQELVIWYGEVPGIEKAMQLLIDHGAKLHFDGKTILDYVNNKNPQNVVIRKILQDALRRQAEEHGPEPMDTSD